MTRSFHALAGQHAELAGELHRHQLALVEDRAEAARAALRRYARHLRAHVRAEEEALYPAYEELGPHDPGAGLELFRAEHNKILCRLSRLEAQVLEGGPMPAGLRLQWIEEQAALKHLLDHHHQREERAMVPALEAGLSPARREAVWERWDEIHAQEGVPAAGGGAAPGQSGP